MTNLRNAGSYNIGLDLGTNSVGWAVTDEKGQLLRFRGRPTWGSRLFDEGDTAEKTRKFRGVRRRYARRRWRLNLLQGIFAEEMEKTDADFFVRTNQSRLHREDRAENCRDYENPFFNGEPFTEAEYYAQFPTIFHLRKHLMESSEKADLRLIYLALHNIVKYRGNFLHQENDGLSAKNAKIDQAVEALCLELTDWCEEKGVPCEPNTAAMIQAFSGDYRASIQEELLAALNLSSKEKEHKNFAKAVSKALVGYKVDFSHIFPEVESASFTLYDDDSVEAFPCPDDGLALFEGLQTVYSAYVLTGILSGGTGEYLSVCKVRDYEKYREDLTLLKKLVKKCTNKEGYEAFFRGALYEDESGYDPSLAEGYTAYNLKKLSYDDFKKSVEAVLQKLPAEYAADRDRIMAEFEAGTFLRRLRTSNNGVIPFQLHREELREIIAKQGVHYPFLLENKEKLEKLVSFRIPYYVGPLTTKNAPKQDERLRFAWSKRLPGMENEKVYPWNWDKVIDKDASAEEFIRRMTGTCTYIHNEPVLPRCSLKYELFCVLNELNGARWTQDGDKEYRFDYADRQGILNDLFKTGKTVSYKAAASWLERTHGPAGMKSAGGSFKVRGGQGDAKFESQLSSYNDFCKIMDVSELDENDFPMIEEIILWNTVFEDRAILKRKIRQKYGDRFNDDQIGAIARKRYTGWGRLSELLLCGLKAQTDNGPKSVMDLLEEGDQNNTVRIGRAMNLMEILRDDSLGFTEIIEEENQHRYSEGGLRLEDIPGSPKIRRTINQTLRVVKEIVAIAGHAPSNIYVEVTRSDGEKGKRTTTRYNTLKASLETLKKEEPDVWRAFNNKKPADMDERMVLYFSQLGRCAYSGKALDINRLSDYHIDHVLPQSYIKDDSFENKVLVIMEENERKLDSLLIDFNVQRRQGAYWKKLLDAKLIGPKKYRNLTRTRVSEDQMKGFINRQLVETSQIVKYVQQFLAEMLGDSCAVVPVKAGVSSDIRKICHFPKCRELNDFHHAHDALIATQVGRFIQCRYADAYENPMRMAEAMKKYVKHNAEEYNRTKKAPGTSSFFVASFMHSGIDFETGEIVRDEWNHHEAIATMERSLNIKDCFISVMPEETEGKFWKETVYSPRAKTKKGEKMKLKLPLKKDLSIGKYGGYFEEQYAYFFIYEAIESNKKGERKNVFRFAEVPVSLAATIKAGGKSALEEYAKSLAEKEGLEFVAVTRNRILKKQLIQIGSETFKASAAKAALNAKQAAFTLDEARRISALLEDGTADDSIFAIITAAVKKCSPRLHKQLELEMHAEDFALRNNEDRKKALLSILLLVNGKKEKADLSTIGGKKNAGQLKMNYSALLNDDETAFYLIDQSVTGMFEKRTRLGL